MKVKVVHQILFMVITFVIMIACLGSFVPYVQADNSTGFVTTPQPVIGGVEPYIEPLNESVVEVGGEVYPVDKLTVFAPWLVLAAVLIVGTTIVIRRRKATG